MAVALETSKRPVRGLRFRLRRAEISGRKRIAYLALLNFLVFSACFLIAEIAFRWLSNAKYWVHTNALLVGSGQTEAGKKWWPDTTYLVDSSEFRLEFRTNALGYRARPDVVRGSVPYRIAFVGDSFTEGMQVPVAATFCARLETLLNRNHTSRPFVCENYGVSATDLPDYWQRIIHDVFAGDPKGALVLCIYPGNDFQCVFPDDAFDSQERPLRDYFTKPGWCKHLIAWVNLHSKFGSYLQRALFSIGGRAALRPSQGPKNWWTDPKLAESASGAPAVRRSRSLLKAIDEECRRHGTKLCVLVVGPVANYAEKNGESPLERILAGWGLDIPVIDVAVRARAKPDYERLIFPVDGHLNENGHAFLAQEAAPALEAVLTAAERTSLR
jgi:hypothetical protein